jgi:hypothetical protein
MHFSGGRTEDADGDVLAMLEATGNQIGQFMQHQRVQQDLRTSEAAARKLSLVASHTSTRSLLLIPTAALNG